MKQNGFNIGNVKAENNLFLAPMAGFSDVGFRSLCKKFGAGWTETEMISAKALLYNNEKTKRMLACASNEKPKIVQLFGHEPEVFAKVVSSGVLSSFDVIDINMGCPAPKIYNNGDGCALMKNPALAQKIIEAVVGSTDKPVMVKFRSGVDDKHLNYLEFAKMCENAGASAVVLHPRTREQFYANHSNWEHIREVADSVSIPVIASGDVKSRADYANLIENYGASGVMIGRGALGNPNIFCECMGKENSQDKYKSLMYIQKTLLKYFEEGYVLGQMRAHLVHFVKNIPCAAETKVKLLKIETLKELNKELRNVLKNAKTVL